jgi:hypothetical protein
VRGFWTTSFNANGFIIAARTEKWYLLILFLLRDSPETIPCSVEPNIPFAPECNSVPGQISNDFSRIDVPRGHLDGHIAFPWGFNTTVQGVGTLKHTWNNKVVAETLPTYICGSSSIPNIPPNPIATVDWYRTWDPSGKGAFVYSLEVVSYGAYKLNARCRDRPDAILDPAQRLFRRSRVQTFRLQITDAPKMLSIITTPSPAYLPPPTIAPSSYFLCADPGSISRKRTRRRAGRRRTCSTCSISSTLLEASRCINGRG